MTKDELVDKTKQAVLESQHRFWRALQSQDADLFTKILAKDFTSRSAGQADQDRAAFIATLTSIPVTILNVRGEGIAIHLVGDVAVLTGTQIAQMLLPNGETVTQRLALTNVFQHEDVTWKMILAHPVSLPVTE